MQIQIRSRAPAFLVPFLISACASAPPAAPNREWTVDVGANLQRLVRQEDTDNDQKITVADRTTPFLLKAVDGAEYAVEGVYPLSVLLQELGMAQLAGKPRLRISSETIHEEPVARTSRMIREY